MSVAAAAEPTTLASDDIKRAFSGSLLELDTPLGTTLPIRFGEDGLMSGEAGKLASYLGAEKDRGRWWVVKNQLCYKWFRWFDAEQSCLSLRLQGPRVFWRQDDGKRGTATIMAQATPPPAPEAPVVAAAPVVVASVAARPAKLTIETKTDLLSPIRVNRPARADNKSEKASDGIATRIVPVRLMSAEAASTAGVFTVGQHISPVLGSRTRAREERQRQKQMAAASAAKTKLLTAWTTTTSALPQKSPRTASASDQIALYSVTGVDDWDILNVRRGPSEDHAVASVIPSNGRGVRVVGQCSNGWCPVDFRGNTGWVNSYYLEKETASAQR